MCALRDMQYALDIILFSFLLAFLFPNTVLDRLRNPAFLLNRWVFQILIPLIKTFYVVHLYFIKKIRNFQQVQH